MEFGSVRLNGIARLYNAGTQADFERERDNLRGRFDRLAAELSSRRSGPFFQCAQFTLVDAVFGPIFRYFDVFEARAGLRLLEDLPRIEMRRVSHAERPSARDAVDDDYPDLLAAFSQEPEGLHKRPGRVRRRAALPLIALPRQFLKPFGQTVRAKRVRPHLVLQNRSSRLI
jgi:glutathione S-transferase